MELTLAIAIGTLITLAATTVLLMCLRVYHTSTGSARRQGQVLTAITAMENLVADSPNIQVSESNDQILSGSNVLVQASGTTLVNSTGGVILEDVEYFKVTMESEALLSVTMKVKGQEYSFLILTGGTSAGLPGVGTGLGARVFLETLRSQLGTESDENMGYIRVNGISTGLRYATWYNSGWGEEAAWCSCFVSWGLEQCRGYIDGNTPKYASVNSFKAALQNTGAWQPWTGSYVPVSGELIFFDWDLNGTLDHIGVVVKTEAGRVYTIEGNSGGTGNSNGWVREKAYSMSSSYIAGYGRINWIG